LTRPTAALRRPDETTQPSRLGPAANCGSAAQAQSGSALGDKLPRRRRVRHFS